MSKHEFGMMEIAPRPGQRYDAYEPEQYGCISVSDAHILPVLSRLRELRCYWHTLDKVEFGLAYYGVTLIPPESAVAFAEIIWNCHELSELASLLYQAYREGKYVIHFGI